MSWTWKPKHFPVGKRPRERWRMRFLWRPEFELWCYFWAESLRRFFVNRLGENWRVKLRAKGAPSFPAWLQFPDRTETFTIGSFRHWMVRAIMLGFTAKDLEWSLDAEVEKVLSSEDDKTISAAGHVRSVLGSERACRFLSTMSKKHQTEQVEIRGDSTAAVS